MSLADRLDGYARFWAQQAVNQRITEMQQTQKGTQKTGPAVVLSTQTGEDGFITLTVKMQDGTVISGIQPGSSPVGPGVSVVVSAGLKLDG